MVSREFVKRIGAGRIALVLSLSLSIVSCGGGSSTPPPPPVVTTPTVSSFTPSSGNAGTVVTISGQRLTGATTVAFNGSSASTFTVDSATQITATVPAGATTGKVAVTTPGGTALSSGNFTVAVSATPIISGFDPGSGVEGSMVTITGNHFNGTTAVTLHGMNTASFVANSDTEITAIVPVGATTGQFAVTTPSGTATSAGNFTVTTTATGLDFSIDGAYVTQSTQDYPATAVPLVKDRRGWVRVFVKANQTNTSTPDVRVQFSTSCTNNPLTIPAPSASVPLTIDSETSPSWNAPVDSTCIQPGATMTITVDPTNATTEPNPGNKGNNILVKNLNVVALTPWRVTLLPVHTANGNLGNVQNAPRTANEWVEFAKRLHPVPDAVDVIVAATYNSSVNALTNSGGGWNTVLNQIQAKRASDVQATPSLNNRYYYGVVHVDYNNGVAGLGFIGQVGQPGAAAAMGWDYPGFDEVLAHEIGHNFGRDHSPGCNAGDPDTNYPYAGGLIGVTGWDAFASSGNLKSKNTFNDIMNYCNNQWISDYVYKSIFQFRQAQGFDIASITSNGSSEGLLVWGRIENGKMVLEPAFRVPTKSATVPTGPYKWEADDEFGQPLATQAFDAPRVADLPGSAVRMFAFIVPMPAANLDKVNRVRILKDGQEMMHTTPRTQMFGAQAPAAPRYLSGRRAQITWNAEQYPMVMLKDSRTGEVRGFLEGGDATVVDAPDEMEVQYSDGVRGEKIKYHRPTQ